MINKKKVLIVSSGTKLLPILKELMPSMEYSLSVVETIQEAKKKLRTIIFDYLLIQCPVKDEFGIKSAQEIVHSFSVGVILLVKNDIFDQVTYRLKDDSIFVVSMPTNRQMLYQTICLMNTFISQKKVLENEIKKLKKKMKDEHVVTQAKLVLIEQYHWSEQKAHHYIEKVAMDNSIPKIEVANKILEENKND
ncbi:ANTAR domain-containing response regulator [Floccifex sp.]|uniref:ANTAR domain-containing response regulator n=1 Tax=Floccifex sp. TaxID=2815810 RepID=UPI002A74787C|nr:ANTAR domain-containing protein [Floccifex sp.]MDD7280924.1 ANTAR domain-containing protein [Erysipelotrichaceae bacterium]MDY2958716.1 ANTAR domain-containing protein [Floccifex sp.]